VNQTKTRLQSLGLLDRALRGTTDDELQALVDAMDDDHREAVERLAGGGTATPEAIRQAAAKGRIDGTMESLALVLTDASLADCIEQLGDHSENPSTDQLKEVLPGVVERHGVGVTRLMLASTVAGEATAAPVIRDLLKRDELVALPPVETARPSPIVKAPEESDERDALKVKRQELRRKKQADARTRREQSARARHRA